MPSAGMPACARAVTANWTSDKSDRSDKSLDRGAETKNELRLGPLSETGIANRVTPQIWKRIHIQKPSGVHTKFFLLGGEPLSTP
jgi:hypothetical protein